MVTVDTHFKKKVGIPGDQTKLSNLHQIWDTHSAADNLVWSDKDFTVDCYKVK